MKLYKDEYIIEKLSGKLKFRDVDNDPQASQLTLKEFSKRYGNNIFKQKYKIKTERK